MDSLIKQTRAKYPRVQEKTGEASTTGEKRIPPKKSVSFQEKTGEASIAGEKPIPPKKTVSFREKTGEASIAGEKTIPPKKPASFKEDKKKIQNWFRRQFSRQMSSRDYDAPINVMEHATAVAAAAYAIASLEEAEREKPTSPRPDEIALTRPKSRREAVISLQEPGSSSKRFTDQGSIKSSERQDSKRPVTSAEDDSKKPEKSPSIRKAPTSSAIKLDGSDTIKRESSMQKADLPAVKPTSPAAPKRDSPAVKPHRTSPKPPEPPKIRPMREVLPKPGSPPRRPPPPPPNRPEREGEDEAAAWERAEMEKIVQRYEKLKKRIASWEEKKKAKARHKLEKSESELEQKRKRALQKFRADIEYIDQIAGGAMAQALERRKNEEMKVKEKANTVRKTGQVPAPKCLCF